MRDLHQRQLSHRDLKAANILVRPQEHQNEAADAIAPTSLRYHPIRQSASPVALFLIDLVGLESWRQLPRARCVQNLARLHVSFHRHPWISQTDKLRFLRTYMAWGLHGKSGWKYWWREIAQATQKKIARNLRRGRPLS